MQRHKFWFLQERLVFGLVTIFVLVGCFAWFNINEQEDPFFPYRNGLVSIVAPGMSAATIEDTIVQTFERSLATVDGVEVVSSDVTDGNAGVNIELKEAIYDTDLVWQKVREKISEVRAQYAAQLYDFSLNDRVQDTAGILLAINSELTPAETRRYALYVRDELYKLTGVREINLVGDPGEQFEVFYPQELMLETGISPLDIARQISEANALKQMGNINGLNYQTSISSVTRIDGLGALKSVEIETTDNRIFALSELAQIRATPPPVTSESFWLDGKQVLGLSIVIPPNQLRVTDFGEDLLMLVEQLNSKHQQFELQPVFFQPEWTEKRRNDLALSLLYSSLGVGLVLFLLMSRKVALVVTLTIPAITLTSLAIYGMTGGVLQQMSIAGLVISLGLMVDNSIVMSELISRYRGQGHNAIQASQRAIKELFKPLATSTFTTIAAFVPMLLSEGGTADFVRAIPEVVIIAILTSYLLSLVLLPAITNNLKHFKEGGASAVFERIGAALGRLGVHYPRRVIILFIVLIGISFVISGEQQGEFFPKTSRNQAVIDIEGAYGLNHAGTLQLAKQVEGILRQQKEVAKVISFVGNSGPSFYYNLSEAPNKPNVARVVFETAESQVIPALVELLNERFSTYFQDVRVHAREIGQGPPIEAPIEIRVLGDDRNKLLAASEAIFALIHEEPSITDSRRAYVTAKPKFGLEIDELSLHQAGLTRAQMSDFVAWRTTGLRVTALPTERELIPVVIRDQRNVNNSDADYVMNTHMLNAAEDLYPISLFAQAKYTGEAPVLSRHNGFNIRILKADIASEKSAAVMLEKLMPEMQRIADLHQVDLEFGGEYEEESDSSNALIKVLPVGVILLFSALILQFNSFRLTLLVMLTIPLAMVGVKPTLSIVGVNFGFMSILGMLALTGIVVNTAIILIDNVLHKVRQENVALLDAIELATKERLRPVLLTACTTITGMMPLTSPTSPLWPPMAWTIIGGLVTSTVLTLIVLPALLRLMLNEQKIREAK